MMIILRNQKNMRMIEMGKLIKIGIASALVLLVGAFIIAGVMLQKKTTENNNELAKIIAKREELNADQQKIESALSDLNRSISAERSKQENITREMSGIISDGTSLPNNSNTAVVTTGTTNQTTKIPEYRPPVSRAS